MENDYKAREGGGLEYEGAGKPTRGNGAGHQSPPTKVYNFGEQK